MRALQVTRNGPPGEVLEVTEVPVPEPAAGEVRIKVSAASLNFNDIDRCHGRLVSVPVPPPYTLGMDACGVVDAAGAGGEEWLGQRVVAITKLALGGIAEYAIADGVSVFAAPPEFDDAEAAGFLLPYQASHLALFRRGRLRAGETVVVHSAASGLGLAGIQLAKAAGAKVIAVAGGPEKTARCAEFGADLLIDHQAEDFVEAVLAATGDAGAELVYDLAGGDFAERSWRCTAHGGRYLAVGFADDDNNGMTGRPLRMACIGNIDIVGVMLGWVSSVDPGMRRFGFNPFGRDVAEEIHADLLRLAAQGKIRPVIGQRVGLSEAGKALDEHEARRSVGRTVVVLAP
ncbi:MAG TPA: NADPH:quinone oxidoreductase family protein [Streptosporangiaceae bacterium]|jgi:NADPH2:quinone reductase